ncbi:ROK family transcriptional regulator [Bifidobacterium goeldii]|uniref:ROK family transcriptional regulator n=1 Tax=Bifidobacterium goeldii TaxID=2306975 RepID=A0A430FKV3_9BIFI|nr:ROK family transcriptional regulator [Bifidobacterium goeldii]RSX53476.1 ROK family transcriptional regulator [Bifidobacterium goeldii]
MTTQQLNAANLNRNRIFNHIRRTGGISKPELMRALGLSMPTIVKNIAELQQEGLIREDGKLRNASVGRNAVAYTVDPLSKVSIGIDLTKNAWSMLLLDLNGNVADSRTRTIPFSNSREYIENLIADITNLRESNHIPQQRVLGMGISVPALIDNTDNRPSYSKIMDFSKFTMDGIEAQAPYACRLYNDADAACYAEVHDTGVNGNLFYVCLSNNVGGASFVAGNRYEGTNNRACEIGHIAVEWKGKHCYCGQYGCLDCYCSTSALIETGGDLDTFFTKLNAHDSAAEKTWNDYIRHLSRALKSIVLLYDCPIVLGGYIGAKLEPYVQRIEEAVRAIDPYELPVGAIRACTVRDNASTLGAALPFVEEYWKTI